MGVVIVHHMEVSMPASAKIKIVHISACLNLRWLNDGILSKYQLTWFQVKSQKLSEKHLYSYAYRQGFKFHL